MEIRPLGTSDMRISVLGFGAWAIGGGGWMGSMGPQNEADSIPAVHAALDHGMNWIDTTLSPRRSQRTTSRLLPSADVAETEPATIE